MRTCTTRAQSGSTTARSLSAVRLSLSLSLSSELTEEPPGRFARWPRRAVLEPIPTDGYTSSSADIARLTELTRERMLEAIEDLGRKRQEQLRLAGHAVGGEGEGEREALLAGQVRRDETSGETASATVEAPSE